MIILLEVAEAILGLGLGVSEPVHPHSPTLPPIYEEINYETAMDEETEPNEEPEPTQEVYDYMEPNPQDQADEDLIDWLELLISSDLPPSPNGQEIEE